MYNLLLEIEKVKALLQRQPETDLFFVKDLEGRYIWCNKAAEQFLNLTLSEIFMRKNIFDDDTENEKKLINGEVKYSVKYYYFHRERDSQPIYIKAVKSVMLDEYKRPVGIFLSGHNETETRNRDLFFAQIILRQLTQKEKEFFVFNLNSEAPEISEDMNITKSRISQIKNSIKDKLKLSEEEYNTLQKEIKFLFDDSTSKNFPDF